ncbi:MAG TPA: zinc dependent phospholipase C family protein [Vicinamibacterales bacterium]|nr:zinc dependent phospholipase C family protein [Vicinamibacterales bacterium]
MCIGALLLARPAPAYSVLAHESMVDAAWDDVIAPMLKARFGAASADAIKTARAYAYGGSVTPDMGYYPFGSHFFTNLLHYTRSGDFVEALIRDARDVNEYAFALGALAHYVADSTGHPLGTNRAVPLEYPKLRAKFGDEVTYVEDPKRHVMVEFAFDVVHVASGAYLPQAYHDFIGFEVATDLVERAFRETYAIEMKDVFASEDLAIGTFRYTVGTTIPQMTQVAWEKKRDEIERLTPQVQRSAYIYTFTRRQYESDFGTAYRRPGVFARFFVWVVRVMPKIGPFRALAFQTPSPEAERLFTDSFKASRERYRMLLQDVRDNHLDLRNTDFDTGQPTRRGEYTLADGTYAELLARLSSKKAAAPDALRADIMRFYGKVEPAAARDKKERKALEKIEKQLAML